MHSLNDMAQPTFHKQDIQFLFSSGDKWLKLYLKNGIFIANNEIRAAKNSNKVVQVKRDPVSRRHNDVHVEDDVVETGVL